MKTFQEYNKEGCVKPLIMWGCKRCKKEFGCSNSKIYNVWTKDDDKTYCSVHGFLMRDEEFRRKEK